MSDPLTPASRDASAALMLGILGFATCGLLSPLAIYYGSRALHEIEAGDGGFSGARTARLGQVLGILGSTMLLMAIVLALVSVVGLWDLLARG